MKSYLIAASLFDGAKFSARYNLNSLHGDFWYQDGKLFVAAALPDDPPIFEAPDPPMVKKSLEQEVDEIKTRLSQLESKIPEVIKLKADVSSKT